ncbi:MAG: hypothetical protein ACLQU9_13300 [Acidimicrobiales bacterium]|jgi:hypothetical protein
MEARYPASPARCDPAARPVARGATGAAVLPVPGNLVTLFLNTQVLEPVVTPVTPFPILILLTTGWAPGPPREAPFAPGQGVRGGYAAMEERVGTSIA